MEGVWELKSFAKPQLRDYGRFLYSNLSLMMILLEEMMTILDVLMILITFPMKYLILDKEKLRLGMKNNSRSQNTMPQELYGLVKGIFPTKWRSIKLFMKPVRPTSNDPASIDDPNHIAIQVEHSSPREPSNGASSSGSGGAGDGHGGGGAGDGPGGRGDGPGGRGDGPGARDGPGGGGDGPGGGGDGPGGGGDGPGGGDPEGRGAGDGPRDAEPQRRLQEVLLMCFVQGGQLTFTVASKGNGSHSPNEKTLSHIVVGCTFIGCFVGALGIILSYTNPGVVARVTVRIAYLAAAFAFIAAMSLLLPENLMLWISGLAGFTCLAFFVWAIWKGLI